MALRTPLLLGLFALLVRSSDATGALQTAAMHAAANPIRKVVTMLQMMQKKVEEEGEKAEELFQKFQCYCKSSGGGLAESIKAADAKVPELQADIKESSGKAAQLETDVAAHQEDRSSAKKAMDEATALREKEKAAYDKELGESKADLDALTKAIKLISDGMGGSFLQTSAASHLRALLEGQKSLDADRQEVLEFLSGANSNGYAPASGEIVGILKQMKDEMFADQKDTIATEEAAVKDYEALMSAKNKEVSALSKSVEEKLSRKAELGVKVATMKEDLEDTSEAFAEDQAFLADLEKNCAGKEKLHEEEMKMRADETVALADTIKVLNDDDALDLFKKTIPAKSDSFMQVQMTTSAVKFQASAILAEARSRVPRELRGSAATQLDFIALALKGKKAGFDQVIKLVDGLSDTLKKEQGDDDNKKEYCGKQFDESDDKKKDLERTISDHAAVIEDSKEAIEQTSGEIEALTAGIKALDKAVAEATEQRKAENAEHKSLMANNGAAKELILFAKNRMNKFYNPKMYEPPPKRELSEEDRIAVNMGGTAPPTAAPGGIAGTGISVGFLQVRSKAKREAPPPPPETAAAYTKKSGESGGVIAMMDLLVKDVDKEMTISENEEKNAQEEYTQMMEDSAKKRAEDSKLLTDKGAAKAEMQASLEQSTSDKKSTEKEHSGTLAYIQSLHGECDWLIQYYDMRKEARSGEVDSLSKAKAVLSGADFSLLQRPSTARVRKFLRHRG